MLDDKLIRIINDTSVALELSNSVVEKDYYVTQVIHALSGVEDDYFRLVFAGGTCLAKAHRIVKRMSEDVDFKIEFKNVDGGFGKARMLKELRKFRSFINSKLKISELNNEPPIVRNEGQYSKIEINYPSAFPVSMRLRPHILLEFTLSEIRLPTENLAIRTLIENTLENFIIFIPPSTTCISIDETAIEKWVGLTRRIIAIERKYHADDPTLVRHIYDLNSIIQANKINTNFFVLAKEIVSNDAKQFKNQHPEYSADPATEIRQSLAILKNKSLWKKRYQEFIETMVYDDISAHEYENTVEALENLSGNIINSL